MHNMTDTLIMLRDVTKDYGKHRIIDHIDLDIKKGQSIALLGHNGSGKSTLLKMIGGLTRISSGEVRYSSDLKFNYIPEHFPKMHLTVKQYIKHMGLIEGLSSKAIKEKSQEFFKAFFMESMIDTPMKHLSKGTLQKVGVIQAIMSKPDVLLLDEPLSGQDVESQNVFIRYIHQLHKQGVTIIMSCHERFLIQKISNMAYEIKDKQLNPVELIEAYKGEYDILIFAVPAKSIKISTEIEGIIDKIDRNNDKLKIVVQRNKSNRVIAKMIEEGYLLRGMYSE